MLTLRAAITSLFAFFLVAFAAFFFTLQRMNDAELVSDTRRQLKRAGAVRRVHLFRIILNKSRQTLLMYLAKG